MFYKVIYQAVCLVYAGVLRGLVMAAINDPESDIDEFVMELLDKLFGYEG